MPLPSERQREELGRRPRMRAKLTASLPFLLKKSPGSKAEPAPPPFHTMMVMMTRNSPPTKRKRYGQYRGAPV